MLAYAKNMCLKSFHILNVYAMKQILILLNILVPSTYLTILP